ncbi:multiple C2 and transmembrane domain-containing protein 1-like isoform X1 [Orbicella faveolata]|uniref:multiple C2 and transmembrane domain-containing protein 1-like isoform X1 n=1 Tax=Orbicella faveolata TaxID=48498 RepID=UPI0009E5B65F|nr:multiple C2 and transmembrane domain-containing protein 1-like isoform X1 [Orbicella faveolata]
MSDEDLRDANSGKKKGLFASLKRSKSKSGRGRKAAKSRSMPQLPQCQMNGNATKPTDKFNISQPAKGAEEEGAAPLPSPTEAGGLTECPAQDVSPGALAGDVARAGKCSFFALEVELKDGKDLAARDKTDSFSVEFLHEKPVTKPITRAPGTSDPYVKFKSDGKQIYKSKTVQKNLNPQWNEKFCVPIEDITVPLILKVLDFDRVGNDDPMGRAVVDLAAIEIDKPTEMILDLENPDGGQEKLGQICAVFTVQPKNYEDRQEVSRKAAAGKKGQAPKEPGKGQLWDGIVSIILVEGKKMIPMDDSGLSDPYCRFRLGNEKYKTKACKETLSPQWKEQFDLKIFPDSPMMLEVTVWDRDIRKDEFMGRCQIDLSTLEREKSHKIEAALEDNAGIIVMHLSITGLDAPGCESDLNAYTEKPGRRTEITKQYALKATPKKIKEIGWLQVKLHRAVGLASADIGGTSDPFAVIELNNQRLVTHTMYKTLNPAWEKIYEMTVFDIHDVLDITVFDEDKRGAPEFLGRVVIPLLQVTSGEKRLYQLKNKSLESRAKGHLILTLDVEFNPIRAAVRTVNPRDPKIMFEAPKFKRALLQRNIDRVNKLVASLVSTGAFVQSLFTWQYKFRSAFAFAIYIMLCLNFDFYIIPLTLLLTFLKQYVMCMLLAERNVNPEEQEGAPVDEDEDDDDEEEEKGKKGDKGKSFKEKIAALTSICQTVQNALDMVASNGERVKNTFNWTVPFCSYLMCVIFTLGTVVLYLVPLKFLLLAWGINKFTKKIRKPNAVDNNELADFLSRIPSDVEIKEQKVLKTDPSLRLKRIDG